MLTSRSDEFEDITEEDEHMKLHVRIIFFSVHMAHKVFHCFLQQNV